MIFYLKMEGFLNMQNISLNKLKKVHFIGIGGISMSALAEILIEKNIQVSGSDAKASELTNRLSDSGAKILYGQKSENITPDIDLVVYTAAIHKDNPEFMAAQQAGIPMMVRADFLGLIMKEYSNAINVAGTHGKTTTTSMISHILLAGNCDPTILVGGMLPSIGGNLRIGHSENFVNESCEYTNSFLSFFPTTAVILNIAEDHLDFFKDINDIRHSFKRFMQLVPEDGYVILNSDIDDTDYFTRDLDCHIITFGKDPAKSDYSAADITYNERGCCHYTLWKNNVPLGEISLSVPGIHNVYNSLAAIAVGLNMNLSLDVIRQGLLFPSLHLLFFHKEISFSFHQTNHRYQYRCRRRQKKLIPYINSIIYISIEYISFVSGKQHCNICLQTKCRHNDNSCQSASCIPLNQLCQQCRYKDGKKTFCRIRQKNHPIIYTVHCFICQEIHITVFLIPHKQLIRQYSPYRQCFHKYTDCKKQSGNSRFYYYVIPYPRKAFLPHHPICPVIIFSCCKYNCNNSNSACHTS